MESNAMGALHGLCNAPPAVFFWGSGREQSSVGLDLGSGCKLLDNFGGFIALFVNKPGEILLSLLLGLGFFFGSVLGLGLSLAESDKIAFAASDDPVNGLFVGQLDFHIGVGRNTPFIGCSGVFESMDILARGSPVGGNRQFQDTLPVFHLNNILDRTFAVRAGSYDSGSFVILEAGGNDL